MVHIKSKMNKEAVDYREKAIKKQKRKFIISAILSLPLFWTMVGHFSFTSFLYLPDFLMNPWVQMALATPVQFIIGKQFYVSAYKALRNGSANMDVLVVWVHLQLISTVCIKRFKRLDSTCHTASLL